MGLRTEPLATIFPETGKARLSKGTAKSAAKRHGKFGRSDLSAYRCRICRSWHVGKRYKGPRPP